MTDEQAAKLEEKLKKEDTKTSKPEGNSAPNADQPSKDTKSSVPVASATNPDDLSAEDSGDEVFIRPFFLLFNFSRKKKNLSFEPFRSMWCTIFFFFFLILPANDSEPPQTSSVELLYIINYHPWIPFLRNLIPYTTRFTF